MLEARANAHDRWSIVRSFVHSLEGSICMREVNNDRQPLHNGPISSDKEGRPVRHFARARMYVYTTFDLFAHPYPR